MAQKNSDLYPAQNGVNPVLVDGRLLGGASVTVIAKVTGSISANDTIKVCPVHKGEFIVVPECIFFGAGSSGCKVELDGYSGQINGTAQGNFTAVTSGGVAVKVAEEGDLFAKVTGAGISSGCEFVIKKITLN